MNARSKIRHKYNIPGSVSEDCFMATFCPLCAILQMTREVDYREKISVLVMDRSKAKGRKRWRGLRRDATPSPNTPAGHGRPPAVAVPRL